MPRNTKGFASRYPRELHEIMNTAQATLMLKISAMLWNRR